MPRDTDRSPEDAGAVYAALSRGENDRALGLAIRISQLPAHVGNLRSRAELLLLQAESARRLGGLASAEEAVSQAVALMDEYGLSLPMRAIPSSSAVQFVTFAPTLPVRHSSQGNPRQMQPLTPAELRAFHMVVATGNVRAAAKELYLSHDTVKGYIKQVYRKFGVSNRADAIRVASEAQLLPLDDHAPLR